MQSQAMNLSINSEIPNPVAYFIQRCLLLGLMLPFLVSNGGAIKESKIIFLVIERLINTISVWQTDDMIKAAISVCFKVCLFMLFNIPDPKRFILQSFK
jgi:presenilin-like A22 family membrane protease